MIRLAMLLFTFALLAPALGCQERVVGTSDGFVGSQYRSDTVDQPREPTFGQSVGQGFRSTGDFLFGWTGLTGNRRSQPQRMGHIGDIDFEDRASRPQQTTGGQ